MGGLSFLIAVTVALIASVAALWKTAGGADTFMPMIVTYAMALVNAFIGTTGGYDTSQMQNIIDTATMYIRLPAFDSLIASIGFCFTGLINGSGRTVITMITSFVSAIAFRVPLAYIFALGFDLGMFGIGLATAISPIVTVVVGCTYYKSGVWAKKSII